MIHPFWSRHPCTNLCVYLVELILMLKAMRIWTFYFQIPEVFCILRPWSFVQHYKRLYFFPTAYGMIQQALIACTCWYLRDTRLQYTFRIVGLLTLCIVFFFFGCTLFRNNGSFCCPLELRNVSSASLSYFCSLPCKDRRARALFQQMIICDTRRLIL